ncbi:hypothetical protein LTR10_021000 [Elasticomyces elasticus]|uniref:VASt domain-containing protein n=1 Tax=Exophiala sideris TaxID=1016849 RepID=A0ABR0JLP8_9EURO|nr:hypothetical protein LTR10_021000 [Elasticomyces elasticus]KAK5036509.1 hypothetical protein LTS07_002236 [Exophiala sideris]KAK5041662.1 hypothetical protein LTR13_002329 [Exophiala sideris]KAK5066892.1 hypothetical protein LTR69_002240 [Exophiala sideris]KAK5184951.1 hypothetical protein LTR44_002797 [Eurotiomycetes sp. CCFEE 6388]
MPEPIPQLKGLKKVLSNRRRSSDIPSDENIRDLRTNSIDSLTIEKSPTRRSISQDGSSKSASSGMRKLLPGHSKRKRRKLHEEEVKAVTQELARGRKGTGLNPETPSNPSSRRSSNLVPAEGDTSLLTDDSEVETPPLVSRESHIGYLTMSSPLVTTNTTRSDDQPVQSNQPGPPMNNIPTLIEPDQVVDSPSPKSQDVSEPNMLASNTGLTDIADTLGPRSRNNSISSKLRGKSPARKFRDVFSKSNKSPKVSPERRSTDLLAGISSPLSSQSLIAEDEAPEDSKHAEGPPIVEPIVVPTMNQSMPNLDTKDRPFTPPAAIIDTPVTTVTPPTPTHPSAEFVEASGSPEQAKPATESSRIVVSHSGNMISHRRIRSTSSIAHQPSKLSTSTTAPLTPTSESPVSSSAQVPGTRTPSGSLFSSWVSAAQNAANTISSQIAQTRARAGTDASNSSQKQKPHEDPIKEEEESSEVDSPRKQLAIETMGTGDLNFEHLGLNAEEKAASAFRPDLTELRKDSTMEHDVEAAKEEDVLAKRAVSAAYEKLSDTATPVAEIADPLNSIKPSQAFPGQINGDKTPPNDSIFDGEGGTVKRSNSVRSKLANAKRRSRGSSAATVAPKQRNRNFHQQFRSVPEDDYLIEDYSCALQKEILVAGRIYISEGHICFSSNILGWITTLVISFEEVVSIERESTAMVFPNAIAIQTLHARHTFRSLLYREQTYDLLIGIWRVSHPASFQKSMNGKQLAAEDTTDAVDAAAENGASGHGSDVTSSDGSDSDDDNESAPSLAESSPSHASSELAEGKAVSRKPSAMNAPAVAQAASILAGTASDVPPPIAVQAGLPEVAKDFPGPATHAPTECNDGATHYDKICKDEVIPAPLGKIYSLLYGPESGLFVRKFLVDESKCLDLVFEDDKKGLNNDIKSRQYTYIKPLGGSIGPKQTKCITTETLDFFDLEKAVTVSCATQTPDVPSGNAFSVKTRYCLTWAPGNATRFQMNCTIEWSAKSWLKGPIEKGANDGQQQYGDSLVKILKSAVSGRPRGTTGASKTSKTATKKKRKGEKKSKEGVVAEGNKQAENWGLLEPLRGPLQPVADILRPVLTMQVAVGILTFMVVLLWLRGPARGTQLGPYSGLSHSKRIAAYDTIWADEQTEFWDWLEARASVDTVMLRPNSRASAGTSKTDAKSAAKQVQKRKQRSKAAGNDVEAKMREEKISQREMEDAIKITRERLQVLEGVMDKQKQAKTNDKK